MVVINLFQGTAPRCESSVYIHAYVGPFPMFYFVLFVCLFLFLFLSEYKYRQTDGLSLKTNYLLSSTAKMN